MSIGFFFDKIRYLCQKKGIQFERRFVGLQDSLQNLAAHILFLQLCCVGFTNSLTHLYLCLSTKNPLVTVHCLPF